jgi:hypothetical protein
VRYVVQSWPGVSPPPPSRPPPSPSPPPSPPFAPCLVDYRYGTPVGRGGHWGWSLLLFAHSVPGTAMDGMVPDGNCLLIVYRRIRGHYAWGNPDALYCVKALKDYNVAATTGAATNKYTVASGGTATNPGNAIDYSSSASYYQSEVGDGDQYIQIDLGSEHTVIKVVVQWGGAVASLDPADKYMPAGVAFETGVHNEAVINVNDPGRVGTFHPVIVQSNHQLMTASMFHVTNLTPGSANTLAPGYIRYSALAFYNTPVGLDNRTRCIHSLQAPDFKPWNINVISW